MLAMAGHEGYGPAPPGAEVKWRYATPPTKASAVDPVLTFALCLQILCVYGRSADEERATR